MITAIELGDFLSHSQTRLEFGNGVTVFVGQNGAGKSSLMRILVTLMKPSNGNVSVNGFDLNKNQPLVYKKSDQLLMQHGSL